MAMMNDVKKPGLPVVKRQLLFLLGLAGMTLTPVAQATLLTALPGVATSAGSCYLGCGNASYDHSNIIDGDFGASGNTGLNSWNSGYWGGYVQINFGAAYQLDRIELYGANGYFDPYTLFSSLDGVSWSAIANGGYHLEPGLSHADTYQGIKYGAVHDVLGNTLADGVIGQYLRYSVNAGTPHWGYLFELVVEGHTPVISNVNQGDVASNNPAASVPEPATIAMLGLGLGCLGAMRQRREQKFIPEKICK